LLKLSEQEMIVERHFMLQMTEDPKISPYKLLLYMQIGFLLLKDLEILHYFPG